MLERFDKIARYALNTMCLGQVMWGFGAGITAVLLEGADADGLVVIASLCLVGGMFGMIGQNFYRKTDMDRLLALITSMSARRVSEKQEVSHG